MDKVARFNMPLVYLEWMDSARGNGTWHYMSEVEVRGICKIKSLGWVLDEDNDYIWIAPHIDHRADSDHQISGDLFIPKVAIMKRVEITLP